MELNMERTGMDVDKKNMEADMKKWVLCMELLSCHGMRWRLIVRFSLLLMKELGNISRK